MIRLPGYDHIYAGDFEYSFDANGLPDPFCFVVKDLTTGEVIRCGPHDIFVCYSATAEGSGCLALDWPQPPTIVDLYAEFRLLANGRTVRGFKQVDALAEFNLPYMDLATKQAWQARAEQGPPFSDEERRGLLDYCESDSVALERLLPRMLPHLSLPQAHLRGRYMWDLARVQAHGIPMDRARWELLTAHWDDIIDALIAEFDRPYGVYQDRHWRHDAWLRWCQDHGVEWPLTPTGRAETRTQTWMQMAERHPDVTGMAELYTSIGLLDAHAIKVWPDGRHRPWLRPFGTLTGRNMPSPKEYLFGAPSWMRRYIQAPPGYAVAYLDYRGQEIAIAAALSGDPMLQAFYRTGDPYWAFGRHCGLIPADVPIHAVKQRCKEARDLCKILLLGVCYGMTAHGFAKQAGISLLRAEAIIDQHKRLFPQFWRWIKRVVEEAYALGSIASVFGWRYHNVVPERKINGHRMGVSRRTLMDYPAQANGGEIMRLATCMLTEAGFCVGSIIHDAFLLTVPTDGLREHVNEAKRLMERASEAVLDGYTCFVDEAIFPYPEHYSDGKGQRMGHTIDRILSQMIDVERIYAGSGGGDRVVIGGGEGG
jgi:DNA polymerase I